MKKHVRSLTISLAMAVMTVLVPAMVPASAASSYLCTGYAGCNSVGLSTAGYDKVNKNMYWRMTKGHNCTNYAAYRMVQSGMKNARPWSGTGNAYNWGPANSQRTDLSPVVGAVAWWRAGVKGAGRLGHVAYVERVISADEIVISEDNWGGNFHWRRVVRSSGWPSGFIHFTDAGVGSPRGKVDGAISYSSHRLSLKGWAFDPDQATRRVFIRIYVGGPAGVGQRIDLGAAEQTRTDVAKVYPKAGSKHGYNRTVTVRGSGTLPVYVYGLNKSKTPGKAALIGRAVVYVQP